MPPNSPARVSEAGKAQPPAAARCVDELSSLSVPAPRLGRVTTPTTADRGTTTEPTSGPASPAGTGADSPTAAGADSPAGTRADSPTAAGADSPAGAGAGSAADRAPYASDDSGRPVLLLLDGHSLAYRAFYALPAENFSTTTGQPTNAVYGFTSMLINLLRDERPTHVAVAFDLSRQTWRRAEYAEYKAHRTTSPERVQRSGRADQGRA